jgi:hypothetical protein
MFWLDLDKDTELELAEEIASLKDQRSFVRFVRNGLRLMLDLSRGNTDVLTELFPWVLSKTNSDEGGGSGEDATTTRQLNDQLKRLEDLILRQGYAPIPDGVKPSQIAPPPMPDGDFNLEIKQATASTDNNSTYNFLIASALNVYGNVDSLPAACVEYGLRTGRISAGMVAKKATPETPARAGNSGNAKAIAGADVTFDAPSFDDLEIDI